ncbi:MULTISPECIES: hypothetical protein [unclassified Nocardia]|uniref:hypothetical protein n=1 Tax=unclassified Nocardia TaxID=2637762 RepID=UPI00278C4B7B|nr:MULTISPECIES: hypothetical protein [unclassified Nocardia]
MSMLLVYPALAGLVVAVVVVVKCAIAYRLPRGVSGGVWGAPWPEAFWVRPWA